MSRIKVDLNARSFEIEVPDSKIDDVLAKIEEIFAQASEGAGLGTDGNANNDAADGSDGKAEKKRKRAPGAGSKSRSYQLVDLGLSPEQRKQLQDFFAAKAPEKQNDQVAVLGVKLKEFLKREPFSEDEIHSAFKVVNRPTPRNLSAVFGNMKRDGRAGYVDNKVVINSYTDDHVQFHMKKDEGKKGKAK